MITGKLNLLNLVCVRQMIRGKAGDVDCLVIPIEKNKLFVGEKGIYLDLIAFEMKEQKEGRTDTHLVKQSFSKADREKMTEEQLKSIPILGSLNAASTAPSQQEPVSKADILNAEDDLPF